MSQIPGVGSLLSGPNNALFLRGGLLRPRALNAINVYFFYRWPFRSVDKQDLNLFNLNTVIFCSIAVPVSLSFLLCSALPSLQSISLVCLHSYFVSSPRYTFHLSMSNRQHGAIHIHLLIASTSGAWAPSSMSSMNSMDSSTCRSFFISFVFVSFNTLSTRC